MYIVSKNPAHEVASPRASARAQDISKYVPAAHQIDAIAGIEKALSVSGDEVRTQCIITCGGGKTLIEADTVAKHARGECALVLEPSLPLIAQNLRTYRARLPADTQYLVVCSDESVVARPNEDSVIISKDDLNVNVTTRVDDISSFLRAGGSRVVLSTLHSSPLIADACDAIRQKLRNSITPIFKTGIIDEAHRTATHEKSAFSTVLSNEKIPIRERIFFTGTPKVLHENPDGSFVAYSMDNEAHYGKRCYELSFREAVNRGILTDYQIVISAVPADYKTGTYSSAAIAQHALCDAIKQFGLRKILTFHNSVRCAKSWARALEASFAQAGIDRSFLAAVDGTMPSRVREGILTTLLELPNDTVGSVSSCRCLAEGVDLPDVDGALIDGTRNSELEIIQLFGRIVRQPNTTDKKIGTLILPVAVPAGISVEEVISGSNFKTVWRVITALASIDKAYESRCTIRIGGGGRRGGPGGGEGFTIDNLPRHFAEKLKTRVAMTSLGLNKDPLEIETIKVWVLAYFDEHGDAPSKLSGIVKGTDETWLGIDRAIGAQGRGLVDTGYESLSDLCIKIGLRETKLDLDIEQIKVWIQAYHRKHREAPTAKSGTIEGTDLTWGGLNDAIRKQRRGLVNTGFTSLLDLCINMELSEKKLDLNIEQIKEWIRAYHKKHREAPITTSGTIEGTNETWRIVDISLRTQGRGLVNTGFTSLFDLCINMGLSEKKLDLNIEQIKEWIQAYHRKHREAPTTKSGTVEGTSETWRRIDRSIRDQTRGLGDSGFTSLLYLCIKMGLSEKKLDLNIEQIKEWIRVYHQKHGKVPTSRTLGKVEGTNETWIGLDQAIRGQGRGLVNTGFTSLSNLCVKITL